MCWFARRPGQVCRRDAPTQSPLEVHVRQESSRAPLWLPCRRGDSCGARSAARSCRHWCVWGPWENTISDEGHEPVPLLLNRTQAAGIRRETLTLIEMPRVRRIRRLERQLEGCSVTERSTVHTNTFSNEPAREQNVQQGVRAQEGAQVIFGPQ